MISVKRSENFLTEREEVLLLYGVLLFLAVVLPPLFLLYWAERKYRTVEKRNYHEHRLYREIHDLLRRGRYREDVRIRLLRLMRRHRYRLAYETSQSMLFEPVEFFSFRDTLHIDLGAFPNLRQRLQYLQSRAEATTVLLCSVASVEGGLSPVSYREIRRTIAKYVAAAKREGAAPSTVAFMEKELLSLLKRSQSLAPDHRSYLKIFVDDSPREKNALLRKLVYIATLDGANRRKMSMILEIGLHLGLKRSSLERLLHIGRTESHTGQSTIPPHYQILGCRPSDAVSVIKQRYKALVREYHPDLCGSDEDSQERSTRKLQEINEAYHRIKKERGF